MSVTYGAVAGVRSGHATRTTGVVRSTERSYAIQVFTGATIALGYLAATGASIDPLAMAFAVTAAAVALIWPATGLAALALILPMPEPDLLQPVYVDAVILGATGLGCLMMRLPGSGNPRRIHPALVLAIGYGVFSALSILPMVSGYPPEWTPSAALKAIRILSAIGLFMVASYLFRWIPPMRIIAIALIGGLLAAVLALMAFWQLGPLGSVSGLLASTASPDLLVTREAARATGGFSTANYLGLFASQYTLLALAIWPLANARYRPLLAIAIATLVTALVVSFSRNAYIGTAAGVIVLTAMRSPRRAVVLMVVAAAAAAALYPMFLEARLNGADAFDPAAIYQRVQSEHWRQLAFDAGISMFLTQPVFGVGFGMFQNLSPAFIGASPATASHNAYIQIIAEQGIVGALMISGVVIALVTTLLRSSNPLRNAALAMLSAFLVQSFFINSTQSIQATGIVWLTMAAALIAADRLPPPLTAARQFRSTCRCRAAAPEAACPSSG